MKSYAWDQPVLENDYNLGAQALSKLPTVLALEPLT